jgi:cysteinyl-tRNA synthetase
MPVLVTKDGPVEFGSWSYQLQGRGGDPLDPGAVAAIDAGLVVVDYSRNGTADGVFGSAEVVEMQGAGADRKAVLAYISIGESEDFRFYWDEAWTKGGDAGDAFRPGAPDWLGPLNPDWPESRKVRYWDPDWQAIAIDWIETIAAKGFDGAYLDIVDAYYFWAHEVRAKDHEPGDPVNGADAAARMIDFIVGLSSRARAINPDFVLVQQNAPFLLNDLVYDTGGKPKPDPARIAALHEAVAGIAVEDAYLRGGRDEDNRFRPDQATINEILDSYAAEGEFVLSVDYVRKPSLIEKYLSRAERDGFLPYAAPDRDLDRVATHGAIGDDTLAGSPAGDRLYGCGGNDQVFGNGAGDIVMGNRGDDALSGGDGADQMFGGGGRDSLAGGPGNDRLDGGDGRDVFVFAPGDGRDVIAGFSRGDRIDLTAFDATPVDLRLVAHDGGTAMKVGGVRLLLQGVERTSLDADDDFIL